MDIPKSNASVYSEGHHLHAASRGHNLDTASGGRHLIPVCDFYCCRCLCSSSSLSLSPLLLLVVVAVPVVVMVVPKVVPEAVPVVAPVFTLPLVRQAAHVLEPTRPAGALAPKRSVPPPGCKPATTLRRCRCRPRTHPTPRLRLHGPLPPLGSPGSTDVNESWVGRPGFG